MPAQVFENVSTTRDGQGFQRLGLALQATLGGNNAAYIVFDRKRERNVFVDQVNADFGVCVG